MTSPPTTEAPAAAGTAPSPRFADIAGGSVPARFLSGAGFAASGIVFALKQPRVLAWAVIPMMIQAAIFFFLLVMSFRQLDALVERLGPEEGHWYSFLATLLFVGLAVAAVLLSNLLAMLVGSVVCDPFYDLISESTEQALLGRTVGEPFSVVGMVSGIARELVITVGAALDPRTHRRRLRGRGPARASVDLGVRRARGVVAEPGAPRARRA
jgi:hypothetical protein